MLELILNLSVIFVPFLAFLAYMVWDRRRLGRPTAGASSAHQGTGVQRRKITVGFSLIAATMGVWEFVSPRAPPFSGRWGWLWTWAHSHLGQGGIALIWLAISAALLAAAYFGRK